MVNKFDIQLSHKYNYCLNISSLIDTTCVFVVIEVCYVSHNVTCSVESVI